MWVYVWALRQQMMLQWNAASFSLCMYTNRHHLEKRLSEARFRLDKQRDFEAYVYPFFSRRSLLTPELCNVRSLCKILRQLLCWEGLGWIAAFQSPSPRQQRIHLQGDSLLSMRKSHYLLLLYCGYSGFHLLLSFSLPATCWTLSAMSLLVQANQQLYTAGSHFVLLPLWSMMVYEWLRRGL